MFGWAFLSPFLLFFAFSFLIPIVVSVRAAFFREVSKGGLFGGGEKVETFVGLQNFKEVALGSTFWTGIGRVLLFGAIQIPVMIIGALALALLLDSLLVNRVGFFRLGYFMPYAVPGIVAALVWVYLYNNQIGPVGRVLNIDFFGHTWILAGMANMTTWTFTGYNMLIFLAALQAIPTDLYEAARLDGASEWMIVWKIKVPMVRAAALLAVLLSIIGTVQLFNEPAAMAVKASWMGGSYMPMQMAYNTMVGTVSPSGAGPANAISIMMALVASVLAVIYAWAQKKVD
ncbi:ABC transporter permease [Boudabousia tangfeifanii]|uniref:ABC transporter permease n=1 Tax=Boudabousia tangfeifanii TaxID=1912795 RepID=A0A1D9MMQ8_9ACTO|nr:sugar ABC transporter permease [Boudabousia tangfeifanii]AOZ73528.1 ABC transporter permease [Boudabousia tangfeifanii]